MDDSLKIKLSSFTLDCQHPLELSKFYTKLLNWTVVFSDEQYTVLAPKETNQGTYPSITFQLNSSYVAPVWPETLDEQQQMAHLDFAVNDLDKAVKYALDCGASISDQQFSDRWSVMFDPAGHPFCLVLMKDLFQSPDFALR